MEAKALSLSFEWACDVGLNLEGVESDALLYSQWSQKILQAIHMSFVISLLMYLIYYHFSQELMFLMYITLVIKQHMACTICS